MSTLLALDTATEACSVALLHDGKITSHYEVIPRQHAQKLLPMIQTLLADAGIALSAVDAQRIGLDYSKGQLVQMRTANGNAAGYRLRLQSVRVGDVEVYDIDAIVSQQPMPFVLLGNSFLNRFSMRRDADEMILEKRY